MTSQDMIDRDLRVLIGDMQLQLVFARARIAELEQQLGAAYAKEKAMANGPMPEAFEEAAAAH